MQVSVISVLLATTIVLSGCNNQPAATTTTTETVEQTTIIQESAAETTPSPTYNIRKARRQTISTVAPTTTTVENTEEVATTVTNETELKPQIDTKVKPSQVSNWLPNEALLFRGRELIKGLNRELGHTASQPEMQKRLQTHMGITAVQAAAVITKLGM